MKKQRERTLGLLDTDYSVLIARGREVGGGGRR